MLHLILKLPKLHAQTNYFSDPYNDYPCLLSQKRRKFLLVYEEKRRGKYLDRKNLAVKWREKGQSPIKKTDHRKK